MSIRIRRRIGIIFHGEKLWFSELVGLLIVISLSLTLAVFTFFIILNQITIHSNDQKLAELSVEKVLLTHELTELREHDQIARVLSKIIDKKIRKDVINKLAGIVFTNSKQFGYDPLLLMAVIFQESFFNPNALGRYQSGQLSGAVGLMQLKPETAREIAKDLQITITSDKDLFKPEINAILGVAYLTRLIGRFKSFKLGLLAYNQGPGVIRENLTNRTEMSIQYYQKVLRRYYRLKKLAGVKIDTIPLVLTK